jgi:hypothetical protein
MRVLMLAAAMCVAMQAVTVVTQAKITGPDGHLATGTITIQATAPFLAPDGTWVEQVQRTVALVNGAFAIGLQPNAVGTAYEVRWELDDTKARTEYWVVPAGSAVGVCAVEAQLVSGVWVTVGCAGGTVSWRLLTVGQWAAMTYSAWIGTVI